MAGDMHGRRIWIWPAVGGVVAVLAAVPGTSWAQCASTTTIACGETKNGALSMLGDAFPRTNGSAIAGAFVVVEGEPA